MTASSTEFFNDAVGEIGNMMMGAGATNLAGLLGAPVSVTTPRVDLGIPDAAWPPGRSVVVRIQLSGAVTGNSVFLLPTNQVVEIVKLMTQGMELPDEEILGEFGMSAIGEAMNQLIAGAARALSDILGSLVDITPPVIAIQERDEIDLGFDPEKVVTVSFDVQIGSMAMGRLAWLIDRDFAGNLIGTVEANMAGGAPAPAPEPVPAPVPAAPAPAPTAAPVAAPSPPPPAPAPVAAAPAPQVQPAAYPELRPTGPPASAADIAKLADVTLNVTVELGRTALKVKELLALGPGSVVELDRVAGAPVDILVNGTLVARGDVVVVDDELGVRVNEVIDPSDRRSI